MITVHHLENSRSQRILWVLEELGLPYEIKFYKRDKTTLLAPPELKAIHPLGKSPVITDGERVIAESGLILDYLVSKYGKGKLKPESEDDVLRYQYWLHYAEGSLMSPLFLLLVFSKVENGPMPFFVRPVAKQIANKVRHAWILPQLKLHLDYLEKEIAKTGWFAGSEFSAADIMMFYPLEAVDEGGGLKRPHLEEFMKKVKTRPAFQRALERGGPFSVIPRSSKK
jgi:glutathione S-transferase